MSGITREVIIINEYIKGIKGVVSIVENKRE